MTQYDAEIEKITNIQSKILALLKKNDLPADHKDRLHAHLKTIKQRLIDISIKIDHGLLYGEHSAVYLS